MENFILYILKINLFAAVMIVLVKLISLLVKKRYLAQWKYVMWLFISLFLLIPVGYFMEMSVIHLEIEPQHVIGNSTNSDMENAVESSGSMAASEDTVLETGNLQNSITSGANGINSVNNNQSQSAESAQTSVNGRLHILVDVKRVLSIVTVIWLVGMILLTISRVILYQFTKKSLKRWALNVKDATTMDVYEWICERKQVKNPPRLMINENLETPVLTGLIKPYLYLPDNSYTGKELELIFTHELTHFQYKDLWYKLLLLAVDTIYWLNPLLYLMVKESEKDIEYICDSRVIRDCTHEQFIMYDRLLLKTAAAHRGVHYLSASLNDGAAAFKERILYMMGAKKMKRGVFLITALTMLLLASNILVGCTLKSEEASTEEKTAANVTQKESTDTESADKGNQAEESSAVTEVEQPPQELNPEEVDISGSVEPTGEETVENEQTTEEASAGMDMGVGDKWYTLDEYNDRFSNSTTEEVEQPAAAAVQVYEGSYMDSSIFGDGEVGNYYEVAVSNVTDNSFDFAIYETNMGTGAQDVVYGTHTATFVGDGSEAVCNGSKLNLTFSFPDNHSTHPVATDMEVSGLSEISSISFVNNGIPGHEFS